MSKYAELRRAAIKEFERKWQDGHIATTRLERSRHQRREETQRRRRNFAEHLSKHIDALNLSLREVADRAGVDYARLRRWVTKGLSRRNEDVAKLEEFFGVDDLWMWNWTAEKRAVVEQLKQLQTLRGVDYWEDYWKIERAIQEAHKKHFG